MATKKDNLPIKADVDLENGGTITYANEVIATIAGVSANEVDGIAGMSVGSGINEILGRNRSVTRGVKVEIANQEVTVDLSIVVEYGYPIQKVASDVQENVRRALESLTGLHVNKVDVHVLGVDFENEKQAALESLNASEQPLLEDATQDDYQPIPGVIVEDDESAPEVEEAKQADEADTNEANE